MTPSQLQRNNFFVQRGNLKVADVDEYGPHFAPSNVYRTMTPISDMPQFVVARNPLRSDEQHNRFMLSQLLLNWWRAHYPGEDIEGSEWR